MLTNPAFTLAFAAAAGVTFIIAANRIRIPSIALLLVAGVLSGPEGIGLIDPDVLGSGLRLIVGLTVAVILFEGGLTLDLAGARRSPVVIGRVLTIGVIVTWVGTALTLMWLFDLALPVALLCGSLVIVTGPTVISPLLRRIGVRERIKNVLYWEAVLVDAIGVFIAVLCFEWLFTADESSTLSPLARFGGRVALGMAIGAATGAIVALLLRLHFVSEEYANIFVLSVALLGYAICESVLHESGILAVIIAGLVVGLTRPKQLAQIKRFKLELTELGIGTLFILLAARLDLDPFFDYGWRLVAAVAILLLVLRPLVIVISTRGRAFSVQEKLFLSWIAPRGIVAAFMASLFAIEMSQTPETMVHGQFLQTFTFAVIATTVILQGLSAPVVARLLGLEAEPRRAWLIAGHDEVASSIAAEIRRAGGHALALAMPDQGQAKDENEDDELIRANPIDAALLEDQRFTEVGAVVAVSGDPYFNQLICARWSELVAPSQCYRIADATIDREDGGDKSTKFAGQPIWDNAALLDDLQHGIESGTLAIDSILNTPAERIQIEQCVAPLFWVNGPDQVSICPGAGERPDNGHLDGGAFVVVRPRIPGLMELIASCVIVDDEAPSFDTVLEQLLDQAASQFPDLPIAELRASIIERERSMPTAMGSGVAIPHAYYTGIERSHCFVANVTHGLTGTETPDGKPIRLVFLVLSPVGQAEQHLHSLATIARLTSDAAYTGLIEQADSQQALLARIVSRG